MNQRQYQNVVEAAQAAVGLWSTAELEALQEGLRKARQQDCVGEFLEGLDQIDRRLIANIADVAILSLVRARKMQAGLWQY